MLASRNGALAAVALALVVGVTAFMLRGDGDRRSLVAPADRDAGRGLPGVRDVRLPMKTASAREELREERIGESGDETAGLGSQADSPERVAFGRVAGVVRDGRGYPAADALWTFTSDDSSGRRTATSDAHGNFELNRVRVGAWRAHHTHVHPAVCRPMLSSGTEFEVREGEVTWLDLGAPGGSGSVYGAFLLAIDQASYVTNAGERIQRAVEVDLELELVSVDDDRGVVATGSAWVAGFDAAKEQRMKFLKKEGAAAADPAPYGPEHWRKGAFYFGGLEPGLYVLRIVPRGNERVSVTLDDGTELDFELGIEREVFVDEGEVELPHETLSMEETFFLPALERALQRRAR